MYKVAIVDDERAVVAQLSKLLKEYGEIEKFEFAIEEFNTGEELLKSNFDELDILFLDIDMPGLNGLQVAEKIRERSQGVLIFFCTNLMQYAINGYEVNALGYLLKPIHPASFHRNLKKACDILMKNQNTKISVKTLHGQKLFSLNDIVYVEVQRHNLFFYLLNDGALQAVRTRGSMLEVSSKLMRSDFARCSVCYLVNMHHIMSVENNIIHMPGVQLPISRTCKKEFSETFMNFLREYEVENI